MTSKRSWLDLYISRALVKENLKRFWGISAVAFFLLFLAGPYDILTNYSRLNANTVLSSLSYSQNGTYIVLSAALPLVAAVSVFSYLSHTASTTALHAMPMSRSKLFWSNCLSGYLIAALPVLANTVFLVAIQKNVYTTDLNGGEYGAGRYNIYNGEMIFGGMGQMLLVMLFTFAICAIAATLCGNSVIHFLTSCALNVIVPVLLVTLNAYGSLFLYGFTDDVVSYRFIRLFHPLLYYLSDQVFGYKTDASVGSIVLAAVLYLVACAVLFAIGWALYRHRKMERAGESYVYKFFGYAVNFLIMYLFATLFGLLLLSLNRPLGIILGAVLGFVIGRMIVCKTFRILNRDTFKHAAIYGAILAVLVLGFVFDFFGIERYVPNPSQVESVRVVTDAIEGDYRTTINVKQPENIERMTNFHRKMTGTENEWLNDDGQSAYVYFDYTLKNGQTVRRRYNVVPTRLILEDADYRALYESEEYTGWLSVASMEPSLCDFTLFSNMSGEAMTILDKDYGNSNLSYSSSIFNTAPEFREEKRTALKKELLEAIREDMLSMSLDDAGKSRVALGTITIEERRLYQAGDEDHDGDDRTARYYEYGDDGKPSITHTELTIPVCSNYPNTLQWLKDNGLYDFFVIREGKGFCVIGRDSESSYSFAYTSDEKDAILTVPESTEDAIIVTSEEDMLAVYECLYKWSYQAETSTKPTGYALFFVKNTDNFQVERYFANYGSWIDVGKLPADLRTQVEEMLARR